MLRGLRALLLGTGLRVEGSYLFGFIACGAVGSVRVGEFRASTPGLQDIRAFELGLRFAGSNVGAFIIMFNRVSGGPDYYFSSWGS